MRYRDAVAEARRLVKRSEEDQWRLAELTAEILDSGKSTREWADDIAVSAGHVSMLRKVWKAYSGNTDRPPFRDAYAEAKGLPVDAAERRQMEADRNVAGRSVAERARMAAELLEDEDVAEEVEEMQASRRGVTPPADWETAPAEVANNMAQRLGTDLATSALRAAAGALAEAILCKERFGIEHPDQEMEALGAIERYLAAYKAGGHVSDGDRDWLEAIGIKL